MVKLYGKHNYHKKILLFSYICVAKNAYLGPNYGLCVIYDLLQ